MIEIPFWLVLSLFAVLFWGIGEILTKKATGVLRAPTMLLFYAWAALIVWGGYWYLKGHPLMPLTSIATIAGVIASLCFAIGMIFYYVALDMKFSKISIVSPITGAVPIITVLLAVIFLNEKFHILAALGILSVILGSILLGIKDLEEKYNKKIYFLSFFCLILWSFGDVLAKVSIDMSSHIYFMLLYFLIGFVIWNLYYITKTYSKERMPSNNGTKKVGVFCGVLSVALFTIGSIFIYLAFESGLVSLVSPITNGYPILTVVIAHSFLNEKLKINQKIAITLFIFGTILIGVT
jgi:drug/metabolite transporter (DMT)-like permease